jgi:hypothetical protein
MMAAGKGVLRISLPRRLADWGILVHGDCGLMRSGVLV